MRGFVLACLLLWAAADHAISQPGQQPGKKEIAVETAILAGKIVPVEGNTMDHGVLLVGGGKILKMGAQGKIKIPAGANVIDAGNLWAFPGIVEAHTHIGLSGGLNDMVYPLNPDLSVAGSIDPENIEAARALTEGITTINTMPGSGTNFAGFTVIIKLMGKTPQERILRDPGCMKVAQAFNPERRTGDMGGSRMGMAFMLRQIMRDGKAYAQAWRDYEAGKTREKPALRRDLERMRLVFEGKIPVINHTYSGWGVAEAIRMFHDEFGTSLIATHTAFGGFRSGEMAAKRPWSKVFVNIGPRLVEYRNMEDGRLHNMATEYWDRGVRRLSINTDAFAFYYGRLNPQHHLFYQAAMASHYGLDEIPSIRAITIEPALALNIQDRVGSLKVGKDADIVLKRRSLLDVTSPVDMVLINGKVAFHREGAAVTIRPAEKKEEATP